MKGNGSKFQWSDSDSCESVSVCSLPVEIGQILNEDHWDQTAAESKTQKGRTENRSRHCFYVLEKQRGSSRADSLRETEKSRRVERNMWNRKDGAGICMCVQVWFWLCGLFVGRSIKSPRQRQFILKFLLRSTSVCCRVTELLDAQTAAGKTCFYCFLLIQSGGLFFFFLMSLN